MNPGIDERRVAVEAISTLAHHKNMLVEMILRPAGVPVEVYKRFLTQRDPVTERVLSKRQVAPLILDAVGNRPDCSGVVRNIIRIAASWNRFDLATDEYGALAAALKAP